MIGKVISLKEAVKSLHSEDLVAIGGLTIHRKPMAFFHETIRSNLRNLNILTFGGGPEIDLLVAAKCVRKVAAAFVGFEILGFASNFRRAVEKKEIEFKEYTEYSIIAGLRATAICAEFIPSKVLIGSDLQRRLGYKTLNSPFTNEELIAYPPIKPDVAIIHTQRSDIFGNAQIEGVIAIDDLLVKSSKKVILTVEKITQPRDVMKESGKTRISSSFVDAIVEAPFGAHPTSCYPHYAYDLIHLQEILEKTESGNFENYIQEYISGVDSFQEYLNKVGDKSLSRITPKM